MPSGKPVAFKVASMLPVVARNVTMERHTADPERKRLYQRNAQ